LSVILKAIIWRKKATGQKWAKKYTVLRCVIRPEKREKQNYGNIFKRFEIVGTYQKNRNCGNLLKKIGIVGTSEKNRKKSKLWEHIYV
jgi:hypothetical protein